MEAWQHNAAFVIQFVFTETLPHINGKFMTGFSLRD
jgi:hypothetical protein